MATTIIHLPDGTREVVRDALLAELRFQANALQADVEHSPIEPLNVADAQTKVERLQVIIETLGRLGFSHAEEESD